MDALVEAAMEKVNKSIKSLENATSVQHRERMIASAVHTVDALKSALKAIM